MKHPATLIVHTVSGPEPCCDDHAEKLHRLMSFMGCYVNATPAPDGAECSNCKNEAPLKAAKSKAGRGSAT